MTTAWQVRVPFDAPPGQGSRTGPFAGRIRHVTIISNRHSTAAPVELQMKKQDVLDLINRLIDPEQLIDELYVRAKVESA